ncbi:ATP-dependent helicase HrpB [Labrys monachus]|uniref:ATP-dependent helicase HrpB n=1 Tax=Labrys monachus TaxID=217067 RepID=A0ABU0FEC0_9HYPH|nr:ATP-dependent helicase HrpB [Labrys monachus]MDQ0392400.1 ATP-dependent helicase HrpB [Labrys monachus]
MRIFDQPLPIDEVLAALTRALRERPNAVLVAPPGAGKTTRVPLVLMDEPWAGAGRIIVLEPRRLAARAAAARMASTLGEPVGATVGLRVRLESRISARTRIEVVTEGVFSRMILDDPSLEGIAAVLFDEFHERSLDADQGLAFALDAQAGLREDLRILPMSATLDGARVAGLLGSAPVIESAGRAYPVTTHYVGRDPRGRIEDAVCDAVMRALRAERGSLLVFLPGQGEILRVARVLAEKGCGGDVDIAPLFGAMEARDQDKAVSPAPAGRRKVVLATSIAETSLTIEGVRVVVDSGLARVPRYEPDIGLTRLETVRVSRAGADQRRGRAGRTEPGVCYRLWEEAATGALEPFARPEILSADLSPLLLDCAAWGVSDPARLSWLDAPPKPALIEARALLVGIEALDGEGRLTEAGRRLSALALPPRLARMIVAAGEEAPLAAEIAAVLSERGLGGDGTDLVERIERFRRDRGARAQDMRRLAQGWARTVTRQAGREAQGAGDPARAGAVLALAFPDRVAVARGQPGAFTMENGRAARVEPHDRLAREPFLAIAEIAGSAGASRILLAAPLTAQEVEALPGVGETVSVGFDAATAGLRARSVKRYRRLVLQETPAALPLDGEAARLLARGIAQLGLDRLPWTRAQRQLRDRVAFLRASGSPGWPDLSDAALAATAEDWLAAAIEGSRGLSSITADQLESALAGLLPWNERRRLDAEAPAFFEAPTGSNLAIDYEAEGGPAIHVRVQELFGLSVHPSIAGGRVPLAIHLLSPAHRPVQVTKDLPGFWKGSYAAVRAEMKGRYPRHPWPEDPAAAAPTTRAKPRGT